MPALRRALTVEQVAVRLNTRPRNVRELLHTGALRGFRPTARAEKGTRPGRWRVDEDDLEAYVERLKEAAAPADPHAYQPPEENVFG